MAGLDEKGFTPKTLAEIQTELQAELEENLANVGEVVNATPSSRFGQLIDIFSSQMSEAWNGLQDIYNSYFPLTSTGTSLDEANSLTNVPRLAAKSSQATVYLTGALGTLIPQTKRITVTGTTNDFMLSSKTTVGPPDGSDYEIVEDSSAVHVDNISNAGTITLGYGGLSTVIGFDDTPTEIKAAIESLDASLDVNVVGGFDGVALGATEGPGFCHIDLVSTSLDKQLTVFDSTLNFQSPLIVNLSFQAPSINVMTFATPALAGNIFLNFAGLGGNFIDWDASEAQIKATLELTAEVTEVTVTGTFQFNTSITVEVISSTGSHELEISTNNLTFGDALGYLVNYSTETTANTLGTPVGPISASIGQLATIKDSVSGWEAVYNHFPAIEGRDEETDAAYRFRRYQELSRTGTATANGIKEAVIVAINSDVYNVSLVENDTELTIPGVIDDMLPHSFEVFVNAIQEQSTNDAIAQAIYDSKAVGIQPVSTDQGGRSGSAIDVNDEVITVPFSSTVDVLITIQVTITTNTEYPGDGADQIKRNLVDYFNSLSIGDDVLNHLLYSPVNAVPGILTLSVLTAKPSEGLIPGNQSIGSFETATTTTIDITVVAS